MVKKRKRQQKSVEGTVVVPAPYTSALSAYWYISSTIPSKVSMFTRLLKYVFFRIWSRSIVLKLNVCLFVISKASAPRLRPPGKSSSPRRALSEDSLSLPLSSLLCMLGSSAE